MFGSKSKNRTHPAALDGSDLYAAEAILDSKVERDGTTKYLIKWLGWGTKHNTWEPADNIASKSLIQDFVEQRAARKRNKNTKKFSSGANTSSSNKHSLKKCGKRGPKTDKVLENNKSSTLDSNVKEVDPMIDVNQTKTNECVNKESSNKRLRSRSNSRSSPSLSSLDSHQNNPNKVEIENQTIPKLKTKNMKNLDYSKSKQTSDSQNFKKRSEFQSNSSSVDKSIDITSFGKNEKNISENFKPKVVLERLPKLVFKRYQNFYEIVKTPEEDNNICVEKELSSEVTKVSEKPKDSEVICNEELTKDNSEECDDNKEHKDSEKTKQIENNANPEEVDANEKPGESEEQYETEVIIEEQSVFAEEVVECDNSGQQEIAIESVVSITDSEEIETQSDIIQNDVIEDQINNQIESITLSSETNDNQNDDSIEVIKPQSPEMIVPDCNDNDIEEGEVFTEVCEPIIVENTTAEEVISSVDQQSSPFESFDSEEQNQIESTVEDMVEITVVLTEENIEFIDNSKNEDFVVEMSEQMEVNTIDTTSQHTFEGHTIEESSEQCLEVIKPEEPEDMKGRLLSDEVILSDNTSVNEESDIESYDIIIDEVEEIEDPSLQVSNSEPIPNNDDSIDANLIVRQPSNERQEDEDSIKNPIAVQNDDQISNDAVKKSTFETRLDFKNLITNQNKSNKDNDLLDLTFNDDIMLDTIENNYINSVHRTGDKESDSKNSLSASLYSPISDEERWSSVESESSPESVSFECDKKNGTQKSTEKTDSTPPKITTVCEKVFESEAIEAEHNNAYQMRDSASIESLSPTSSKWSTHSDIIDNRVQTISFHRSMHSIAEINSSPAPPSVSLVQNHPPVTCNTPVLISQILTAQTYSKPMETLTTDVMQSQVNSQKNNRSNNDLQATSALLSGILMDNNSHDSSVVSIRHSPTHQINEKDNELRRSSKSMPSPAQALPQQTSVITTLSSKIPAHSSRAPLAVSTTESSVADASNWPVLSQTNPPTPDPRPSYRPTSVIDRMPSPLIPYNNSFMSSSPTNLLRPRIHPNMIIENQMRNRLTELRPLMSEPRKRGRPPSNPQIRSHPYIPPNTSYHQLISVGQHRQHFNTHQFPSPITTNVKQSNQIMPIRTDINSLNTQSAHTSPDLRLRHGIPSNIYQMRNEIRGQPPYTGYMPPDRPLMKQMLTPLYCGMSGQSQPHNNPVDMSRPMLRPPTDYNSQPQLRTLDRSHSSPTSRPYPYQSISTSIPYGSSSHISRPQSDPQSHSSSQPPFMLTQLDSPQKITLVPKQSTEIRDKIMQTINNPVRHGLSSGFRNAQEMRDPHEFNAFMRGYQQKVGNEENILNKERVAERILDPRYHLNGSPYYPSRNERQIMGQRYEMTVPNINNMNRSPIPNFGEPNQHILRSVLSKNIDPMMTSPSHPNNTSFTSNNNDLCRERQLNIQNEANQNLLESIFISERHSPSSSISSNRTSKTGDKDILSEAMEEIVEYTEVTDNEHLIDGTENVSSHSNDGCSGHISSEEDSSVLCIPPDKNPEEVMELLKSHGFQVIESESQESQTSDILENKTNDSQSDNDLVIQIDEKTFAEVAGDGSAEVLLVFDNNNENQTEITSNPEVGSNLVSDQSSDKIIEKTIDDNNNFVSNEEQIVFEENSGQLEEVIISNVTEDNSIVEKDAQNDSPLKQPIEPTKYVSMPTFVFDSGNQNKNPSKELIDENETQNCDQNESVVEQQNNVNIDHNLEVIKENSEKFKTNSEVIKDNLETSEDNNEIDVEKVDSLDNDKELSDEMSTERVVVINLNDSTDENTNEVKSKNYNQNISTDSLQTDVQNQRPFDEIRPNDESIETIDENMEIDVESEVTDNQNFDKTQGNIIKESDKVVEHITDSISCQPIEVLNTNCKQTIDVINQNTDVLTSTQISENTIDYSKTDGKKSDQIAGNGNKNDSGIGNELSLTEETHEITKESNFDELNTETKVIGEEDNNSEIVSVNNRMESPLSLDTPIDPTPDEKLADISSENKPSEDTPIIDRSDETTPTSDAVQSESVQHPFVSSSVEDFMPNSPSISSFGDSLPPINLKQTKKSGADIQTIDKINEFIKHTIIPELNDSDDEVIVLPTTTTNSRQNNVQINNNLVKSSIIESPNKREVPQNTHQSIDITSNQSKKTSKSGEKRKSKLSSKPPKKMSIREDEEREYLHLIKSRPNGWDKGWSPKEIVGINSLNSTLVFLVKWTNEEQTIVLSEVAKYRCPQLVIKFYEKHSVWDPDDDVVPVHH